MTELKLVVRYQIVQEKDFDNQKDRCMKKKILGVVISALFATTAVANNGDGWCGGDHGIEPHKYHDQAVAAKSVKAFRNIGATAVHDVILFVQPSYFAKYGEYEGTRRIVKMFDNHNAVYADQNINARVNLVTIERTQNVPDDLPFSSEIENGVVVKEGAVSTLSLVSRNEGEIEYEITEKWKADHIAYMREKRTADGAIAGIGSTGSGFFAWMDDGNLELSSIVMSHEIGHNLRASHEIENTPNYVIADAHAFECDTKTSIMWSGSSASTSVPFYSDPDRVLNGQVCGDPNAANNLRVIKNGVVEAAMWRNGVASLGTVQFEQSSYTVNEDNDLTVTLTRSGDLSEGASVRVYTENGTAIHGEDFVDVYQEAIFAPDASSATVTFDIVQDVLTEDNETFNLKLMFPFALTLSENAVVPVSLESSVTVGYPGEFSVTAQSATEGSAIEVTVQRDSGAAGDVIIDLVSENGSAVAGQDYTLVNSPLLFLAGETTKTVMVETLSDGLAEPTETVSFSIDSSAAVDFGIQTVVAQIFDEDSTTPGLADIKGLSGSTTVSEGATIDVELTRSQGFQGELAGTVDLSIGSNTTSATFTFANGENETTVSLNVPDNSADEANYTGTISLVATSPGGEVSNSTLDITIMDNDSAPTQPDNGGDSGGGSIGFGIAMLTLLGVFRRRVTK